ncbi:helix-turn-helix transcriptional regulator [Flavobacterium sp. MDT1-60]|uniref:helix-turn-helix transcriptional regulator n=1 Tax=Flavobacterium sp. MDT1-60 TaxID=1979344 RepID=UPI001782FABE|nr:helix-turn-helix transcriptional regulator [Flavobacterium sp. MDT1-60]QOG02382.1 helix-turn-helix transcriptional regulator [Flavobacterium sp. MDT1-60]
MTENTLKRIKQYIDLKGIKISAFEREIGMSNGSFASQLKNDKTIGVDKLEKILRIYSDINVEWLLTGTGDMLKLNILNEETAPYTKIDTKNPEEALNYKDLAEARKETIESLKKIILYLETQIAKNNQKKD